MIGISTSAVDLTHEPNVINVHTQSQNKHGNLDSSFAYLIFYFLKYLSKSKKNVGATPCSLSRPDSPDKAASGHFTILIPKWERADHQQDFSALALRSPTKTKNK